MTETTAQRTNEPATGLAPLYVDLDGTLIRSDSLWESLFQLLRTKPYLLPALVLWLLGGKAVFKARVAQHVVLDPSLLPYREDVLTFLKQAKAEGSKLILATAAHRSIAHAVADYLGIFDAVLATDDRENLSGEAKLSKIRSHAQSGAFDYIGDSVKDLPILKQARRAHLVAPGRAVEDAVRRAGTLDRVFHVDGDRARLLIRALRPHQWSKNALLAVPLVTAHLVLEMRAWLACLIAFIAFNAIASATYMVNDLFDLNSDRVHASKRARPFASGELSIPFGLAVASLLLFAGAAISGFLLPPVFAAWLALYLVTTLAYSLDLKRRLLIDVIVLAGLFTLRILAGAAAIEVEVSHWLLAFSMFIFTSLAFVKRYTEAVANRDAGQAEISGRGYRGSDVEILLVVGPANGYLAILVLAFYITSPEVTTLYQNPSLLWLLCPLMVYWITRIWFLAHRSELHHDPVLFALMDRQSYILGAIAGAILLFAT